MPSNPWQETSLGHFGRLHRGTDVLLRAGECTGRKNRGCTEQANFGLDLVEFIRVEGDLSSLRDDE